MQEVKILYGALLWECNQVARQTYDGLARSPNPAREAGDGKRGNLLFLDIGEYNPIMVRII